MLAWLVAGWIAFLVLPWNAIAGRGFFAFAWLSTYPFDPKVAPAVIQLVQYRRLWLLPVALLLAVVSPWRAQYAGRSPG